MQNKIMMTKYVNHIEIHSKIRKEYNKHLIKPTLLTFSFKISACFVEVIESCLAF